MAVLPQYFGSSHAGIDFRVLRRSRFGRAARRRQAIGRGAAAMLYDNAALTCTAKTHREPLA